MRKKYLRCAFNNLILTITLLSSEMHEHKSAALASTYFYLYLRRHSPGAGWAGITNCVDHVSDGGTPGSAILRQLTRDLHPVLSPSCVAEDSRSGERFRLALIVVAHVFNWPPARLRHVRGGVGRRRSLIRSPWGRLAACPNQRSFLCMSSTGDAVPRMVHSLRALRVKCGGCCHRQRPPTSFRRLLARRAVNSLPVIRQAFGHGQTGQLALARILDIHKFILWSILFIKPEPLSS